MCTGTGCRRRTHTRWRRTRPSCTLSRLRTAADRRSRCSSCPRRPRTCTCPACHTRSRCLLCTHSRKPVAAERHTSLPGIPPRGRRSSGRPCSTWVHRSRSRSFRRSSPARFRSPGGCCTPPRPCSGGPAAGTGHCSTCTPGPDRGTRRAQRRRRSPCRSSWGARSRTGRHRLDHKCSPYTAGSGRNRDSRTRTAPTPSGRRPSLPASGEAAL